jgi:uncharacterized protein (TIGR03000 family)
MKKNVFFVLARSVAAVAFGAFVCAAADAGGRGGSGHSSQYPVGGAATPRSMQPAAAAIPASLFLPTVQTVAASPGDYAYGSVGTTQAQMILRVPARAEVWFNGEKLAALAGTTRTFTTPVLDPGWDYTYEVRVRWLESNRPVEQNRRILVRAGDRMTLNFLDLPTPRQ